MRFKIFNIAQNILYMMHSQPDISPVIRCRVFTREGCSDKGLSQYKVFISRQVTTLGIWRLSQGEHLSRKTMSWVDTLQLTRAGSQKQNYKSKKQS